MSIKHMWGANLTFNTKAYKAKAALPATDAAGRDRRGTAATLTWFLKLQ